jgi:hypothetical protein
MLIFHCRCLGSVSFEYEWYSCMFIWHRNKFYLVNTAALCCHYHHTNEPSYFFYLSSSLPLPSQYICCLLLFVVKNGELFSTNKEIHPFGTRQHHNLHQHSSNLTKYQMGIYYMGIKLYNRLPTFIKHVSNNYNKFVPLLKKFLCENSFYSSEEFYSYHKPR